MKTAYPNGMHVCDLLPPYNPNIRFMNDKLKVSMKLYANKVCMLELFVAYALE